MKFLISSIKEDLDIVNEFLELRFQTYDLSESCLSKIVNHQSNDLPSHSFLQAEMQLLQFSFFYFIEAERRNDFGNKKRNFSKKRGAGK